MENEIEHPDLDWAKDVVREAKGDRVTEEELETVQWFGTMGCYLLSLIHI